MKSNKSNTIISPILNGIMGGLFICIGCAVNLSVTPKPLGAFLFSIGLFMIISFGFGLYTGKAGYIVQNPPRYIAEVALTLLGNAAGCALGGALIYFSRPALPEAAASIMSAKFSAAPISSFVLAAFCGVLMFAAVDGNRRLSEKGNFAGALFAVVMPVVTFILCGFNHSIADMGYFFISGLSNAGGAAAYFVLVILGNAVGCMLIPLVKKLTDK